MISINPDLPNYRNADFIQYMNNLLGIVTEEHATSLNIAAQRAALQATMDDLNANFSPVRGSELTPEIEALDDKRDRIFVGLKVMVDNWAINHFDLILANEAFVLSDIIKGYGERIHRMRYQMQTATINAIINDFETNHADKVSNLGLDEWIAQLKTVNTAFDTKYLQRAQLNSLEQESVVAGLRGQATEDYRKLRDLYNARAAVAAIDAALNAGEYTEVGNELNTLTEQYNEAVARPDEHEPQG